MGQTHTRWVIIVLLLYLIQLYIDTPDICQRRITIIYTDAPHSKYVNCELQLETLAIIESNEESWMIQDLQVVTQHSSIGTPGVTHLCDWIIGAA